MYEPVYLRLAIAFFVAIKVDSNNFTLNATLKGTEILISKQLLANFLGVLIDIERLYEDQLEVMAQKEKDSKEVFGIGGRFQVKISYFFWEDSPFDQHVFYAAKGWYLPRGK